VNHTHRPIARRVLTHGLLLGALALAGAQAEAQQRFLIERDIPGASKMSYDDLYTALMWSNTMFVLKLSACSRSSQHAPENVASAGHPG
jgi:hypothetical protein